MNLKFTQLFTLTTKQLFETSKGKTGAFGIHNHVLNNCIEKITIQFQANSTKLYKHPSMKLLRRFNLSCEQMAF